MLGITFVFSTVHIDVISSFKSGEFTTVAIVNPPDEKMVNPTYVL